MLRDKKTDEFAEMAIYNLMGTQKHQLSLQFYLTEHCNLKCPGCYMNASPSVSKKTLPSQDIKYLTEIFKTQPMFSNVAVFTGGEIFSTNIEYLQGNIQYLLDSGIALELKTNGSWADDERKSVEIFNMLSNLNVPMGYMATEKEYKEYMKKITPKSGILSYDSAKKKLDERFERASQLDFAMSVDNKIHPKQSADWFVKIAHKITGDSKLSDNLNIKTVSFNDSLGFYFEKVLMNLEYTNFNGAKNLISYKLNGHKIDGHFGEFIDYNMPAKLESFSDILTPSNNAKAPTQLVFFIHPDRTISFESNNMTSLGRVPYLKESGEYKDYPTIMRDMSFRLIDDYVCGCYK